MTTGDPNWQADMLKSPAGNCEQPSSAMQKHSAKGLSELCENTLDGGTNLKVNRKLLKYGSKVINYCQTTYS